MQSRRAEETRPFIVMDILERAEELERAGRRIVHLEVGEPDFDMPPAVREAAMRALRDGATHYTNSLGIRPLREAIARRYAERYGVTVSPDRVVVTAGTSGAFLLLFGLLFEPGDAVLMSDPGYPCYPNFARFVGARPVLVPVDAEDGYALTPEKVQAKLAESPAKAIVISSPANPTGTVTPRATYEWLADTPLKLISDELYHELRYDDAEEFSGLAIDPETFVVDGFSKRYAMTGMRVGWMVVPERFIRPLNKLSQNLYISVCTVSQHAALAALEHAHDDVARMVATYRERHDVLVRGLRDLGIPVEVTPAGAFYVYARTGHLHDDSLELCRWMLEEAGVAATPGVDFGTHRANEHVRFAYTRSVGDIREGIERLGDWLAGPRFQA